MYFIFTTISPVFLLIVLGYIAVKSNYFPKTGIAALTAFVNSIAAPILLFRAMLTMDFNKVFNVALVAPYFVGAIGTFLLTIIVSRSIFKNRPGESVAIGFSSSFVNGLLIGFPIIQTIYGDEAVLLYFTVIAFHSPILYTLGMVTMELSRKDAQPLGITFINAGKNIIKQPLLIGIALGFLGNFLGLTQPLIIDTTTKAITHAVIPCALFAIGGALNNYKIAANFAQAAVVSFMKLFLQPFIVWLVLIPILNTPIEDARIFILLAAMPTGVNAYIFSSYYNRGVNVATNVILISTVASFLSISIWLWLLENIQF